MIVSEALEEVRHLRVSEAYPVTSTEEHLDFERCAALYNAIVKHGWVASGREMASIPARPVWTDETVPEGAQDRLHPDVIEFLKRCLTLDSDRGKTYNFLLFTIDLNPAGGLWEWLERLDEDHLALYIDQDSSSLSCSTVIYDQSDHWCKFDGTCHSHESEEAPRLWQRLETILSAWLELIERSKIVAVHHSVQDRRDDSPVEIDEATGARQEWSDEYPWSAAPFAKQDLVDSLDAWHCLLETINSKLPEPETQPLGSQGLFCQDTLQAAGISEDSFAGNFLASARKPWFGLLGPGLRLATSDDLINNPWKIANDQVESQHRHTDIPIPLLVISVSIDGWYRGRSGAPKILWVLYLEGLSCEDPFPMDDSCRLALPYSLGDNGLALRADGHKLGSFYLPGRFELYQIGQHPYMPCRGAQLYMVLDAFARHAADGLWEVGADGVDEPSTVFQDADTEEGRDEYRLYI